LEERVKDFVVEPDVKKIKVLYNKRDWGLVEKFETMLVTGQDGDDMMKQIALNLLLSNIPRYFSKN
jgi:hypothetical protein